MIKGRHIRHDWQTFVVWEQKSVRTVCGVTSTFGMTGIPGVTPQAEVVEVNGKKYWGWCTRCVNSIQRGLRTAEEHRPDMHIDVVNLYELVTAALTYQWSEQKRIAMQEEIDRHSKSARHNEGRCKTDGRGCAVDDGTPWRT